MEEVENKLKCHICMKTFSRKDNLARHERIHSGVKPFECLICWKRFTDSSSLKSHQKSHTNERDFICNICDKTFTLKCNLDQHLRRHTGEKPFKCSICEKSFSSKSVLIKHIRVHTGEKPHECEVCNKSFSQKGNLSQHMLVHTGEKAFSCDDCGKSFTRSSKLKNHKTKCKGKLLHDSTLAIQFSDFGDLIKQEIKAECETKDEINPLDFLSSEFYEDNGKSSKTKSELNFCAESNNCKETIKQEIHENEDFKGSISMEDSEHQLVQNV